MAVRRSFRAALLAVLLTLGLRQALLFVSAPFQTARAPPSLTLRAFEQGKINLGVDGTVVKSRHMPEPMLEANEATTVAIQDCLEEGCSVEALMELDGKLARDEARVKAMLDNLHDVQSKEYCEDTAEQIAWLSNFLDRSGSLRGQLVAVKSVKEPEPLATQIMKAAAVAFGGGRQGDYPKVGVSPYSS
mmetsp:Transcript_96518/g.133810  ORF Transcript_96518/g.133810 Transcript_96518/m.133810 type:complete len:189 (-) Transcript_96518:116-682(-)|eukprot:s555_g4.t1